ncbi:dynamin family protein [Seiridium cupressi]
MLELLDFIDRFRLQGINHYVSLPQIIVCGDQSSGKSSVLEAISGVSFPIKSSLYTRFPTEIVLRRTPQTGSSVCIVPHSSRNELEQTALVNFYRKLDGFDGLADVVETAKTAIGISMHGKTFSKDLFRIKITGPNRPHLTIVNLPGLIHSETKNQTEPRSIILAVVSAKNDFANQIVLKLARSADGTGNRTLVYSMRLRPSPKTRGRELPGTFNPIIVANLFLEQSGPWEDIIRQHVQKVWRAAKVFLELVVTHIADNSAFKVLFQEVFRPALSALLDMMNSKASKLLQPHQNGHPITYNHYLTESIQQVRTERRRTKVAKVLQEYLGISPVESAATRINTTVNFGELIAALADCITAYYKVALKRFIDDVAVELIEAKLISALMDIFSPVFVYKMSPNLVALIAGECQDNVTRRGQLRKQLDIMQKGSDTCTRFVGVRLGGNYFPDSSSSLLVRELSFGTDGIYSPIGLGQSADDSVDYLSDLDDHDRLPEQSQDSSATSNKPGSTIPQPLESHDIIPEVYGESVAAWPGESLPPEPEVDDVWGVLSASNKKAKKDKKKKKTYMVEEEATMDCRLDNEC